MITDESGYTSGFETYPSPQSNVVGCVKRYDEHPDGGGMREDELGGYVKLEDHTQEISCLKQEADRLRAIALDMQKGYINLKDLVERAQSIISTSTYPNWHASASAALKMTGPVLAPKHTGLRVDYSGLLKNARQGLRREPGTAEMLNQLEEHLSELGRRYYDGDTAVVDEFLQLYCIQRVRREALAATTEGQPDA